MQYFTPGLIRAYKPKLHNLNVICENNVFENVSNIREPSPIINFDSEKVFIKNLTISNSEITSLLRVQTLNSTINNVTMKNLKMSGNNLI